MTVQLMTQPNAIQGMKLQSGIELQIQGSQGKLVSGKRINEAADDAGGISILSKLNTKLLSIAQAIRNNGETIDLFYEFDVEAEQMQTDLLRMRQLAIYANSGAKSNHERSLLDVEYSLLRDRVVDKANNTSKNGVNFHSPFAQNYSFQFGSQSSDQKNYTSSPTLVNNSASLAATSIGTQAGAVTSAAETYTFIDDVVNWRQEMSLRIKFFESNTTSLENMQYTLKLARGKIVDTDMAKQAENLTVGLVRRQVNTNMLSNVKNAVYEIRKLLENI